MTTHPEPEVLALAALPAEAVDHRLVGHLSDCLPCRRHVETMRTLAELARAGGDGPPPAPPERVWQAIVHELADTTPMTTLPGTGLPGARTSAPGDGRAGPGPRDVPARPPGSGPAGPGPLRVVRSVAPVADGADGHPDTERTTALPHAGRADALPHAGRADALADAGRTDALPGAGPTDAGGGRPAGTPPVPDRALRRFRRLAVPLAACLAGIAVGVAGAVGLGLGGAPAESAVAAAQLAPVGPATAGAGGQVLQVAGDGGRTLVVRLDGVTDLAGGDHLEAWLMRPDGSAMVALGSLVPDGSGYRAEFTVPADLPLDRYPVVDVSAERWDGDAGHSQVSLLRGRLA